MKRIRTAAVVLAVCTASSASAGWLDGNVELLVQSNQFSSHAWCQYYNELNQPGAADLTGTHQVLQAIPRMLFETPVQGAGRYEQTLQGPAGPGLCYDTHISAQADPPGPAGVVSAIWTGQPQCAPPLALPPKPPGSAGSELDVDPSNPSPILVDLDGNGFHLVGARDAVLFDIDADGDSDRISWTARGGDDAFLSLDRNRNGVIDDGKELFGTATPLFGGSIAPNGYVALALFDGFGRGGNGDGLISSADSVWSSLLLWTDTDHNGVSEPDELTSLDAAGLLSLDYGYVENERRDRHGNRFRYKSQAAIRSAAGHEHTSQTYDVFFVSAF